MKKKYNTKKRSKKNKYTKHKIRTKRKNKRTKKLNNKSMKKKRSNKSKRGGQLSIQTIRKMITPMAAFLMGDTKSM